MICCARTSTPVEAPRRLPLAKEDATMDRVTDRSNSVTRPPVVLALAFLGGLAANLLYPRVVPADRSRDLDRRCSVRKWVRAGGLGIHNHA